VPPPGTVAVAHRSAPFPLHYSASRAAWPRCGRAVVGRCRAARAVPHRSGLRPPLSALFTPPRGTAPGTPTSPQSRPPLLQKESAMAPHSLLLAPLALLRPRPSEHASRPSRRPSRPDPQCVSNPHGETRQSATISLFGVALTSLVLPHSSRS
jgi:hypothetical protein